MHKTLISVLAVFMLPNLCLAFDYGLVNIDIEDLYEGDTVDKLEEHATITAMHGGTVTAMQSTTKITIMDNGLVGTMNQKSSIGVMFDGTVNTMNNSSSINEIHAGLVGTMNGSSSIGTMFGGTVSTMNDYSSIDTMTDGTVSAMNASSRITTLNHGTVEAMNGSSYIETMAGGTVNAMNDSSHITTLNNGTVEAMNDSSHITALNNGTVRAMNGSSSIETMAGGTVSAMNETSYINTFSGGSVGDIAAGAKINNITGGTIFGNVADGASLNLEGNSTLTLNGDPGKTFDRAIVGGTGSQVTIEKYNLGTNASVTLGEDSLLTLGSVSLPHARFNGGGIVRVDSFDNGVPYANADISTFSAGNSVLFDFDVDFEEGGDGNDTLTIHSVGADNTASQHLIAVIPRSETVTTAREKIDLLHDSTGSLSFSLLDGIVGVGALNYSLNSEAVNATGKQWFLDLYTAKLLSTAANIIGSMPTANLTSVYSLQNALHKRMGDLRNYSEQGIWFRTYTNQTEFNDLIKT